MFLLLLLHTKTVAAAYILLLHTKTVAATQETVFETALGVKHLLLLLFCPQTTSEKGKMSTVCCNSGKLQQFYMELLCGLIRLEMTVILGCKSLKSYLVLIKVLTQGEPIEAGGLNFSLGLWEIGEPCPRIRFDCFTRMWDDSIVVAKLKELTDF
ncbi:hypothetical protein QVD17_30612 [Tagetes erecta]|uniref:Uncharacterized protein n=1 Tax=Tagetes erecta TaxID=13708 RepID=A0AAD8K5K9_TARER|nr:hypothetical protein QVD17_30612 [Tagetes erecta]